MERLLNFSQDQNKSLFFENENKPWLTLESKNNFVFKCTFHNQNIDKDELYLSLPDYDTDSMIQCNDKNELDMCHQTFLDLIDSGYGKLSWLIALDLEDIERFFTKDRAGRFNRYELDASDFEEKKDEFKCFISDIKNSDVFIFIQQPITFEKLYDTLELAQDSLDNTIKDVLFELSTTERPDNKIIISVWSFSSSN